MGLSPSVIRRIGVVLLLAFISVRVGDAHLHMCLDGSEAPVTVHTADSSTHSESHHHQAEHQQDRDVEPLDAVLLKAGLAADVFVLAVSSYLIALIPLPTGHPAEMADLPELRPPSQILPPLRGPPA